MDALEDLDEEEMQIKTIAMSPKDGKGQNVKKNQELCSVKGELLKKVTDQNATRTDARWLSNQTQAIVFNRSEVHMVFSP